MSPSAADPPLIAATITILVFLSSLELLESVSLGFMPELSADSPAHSVISQPKSGYSTFKKIREYLGSNSEKEAVVLR